MKEQLQHTLDNDTFLASWLAGNLENKDLKNLVSKEDFNAYVNIKKGLHIIEDHILPFENSLSEIEFKIECKKKQKQKAKQINWSLAIAASLTLLFGLFTMFTTSIINVETLASESKSIQLIDGSDVILNAESQLSYNEKEWDTNRLVQLEGEAYFKVAKGSTFTVDTHLGEVVVLGTQFNVNASQDYFQVTCFEGKVKVVHENQEYILLPNQSLRKINGHSIEEFENLQTSPSWIHGESSFKSVPLKYVIFALEKQYNIKINASSIDDTQIYTGRFSHDQIDIALASVFKTMNITYRKLDSKNYRLD